jgi:hypothetical protein
MPARRAGARAGRSPHTRPTRWRGHRRPAVGQGAGAPMGFAPAGEGVGAGYSHGDGRSPGGRRDGGAGRRRCSQNFDSAGGSPTAPRGKREGEAGSNLRKTRLSTVSPPERWTTGGGRAQMNSNI